MAARLGGSTFAWAVVCACCGHETTRGRLDGEPHRELRLRGIHHLATGDCEPDEYVTVCPCCGAEDSYDGSVRCCD